MSLKPLSAGSSEEELKSDLNLKSHTITLVTAHLNPIVEFINNNNIVAVVYFNISDPVELTQSHAR